MVKKLIDNCSSAWRRMTRTDFLGLRIVAVLCLLPMVFIFFVNRLQTTSGQFAFVVWLGLAGLLIYKSKHSPAPTADENPNSALPVPRVGSFAGLYLASGILLATALLTQSLPLVYASTFALSLAWILLLHPVFSYRESVWALIVATLAIGLPLSIVRWPIGAAAGSFVALLDSFGQPSYLSSRLVQTGSNFVELSFFDGPLNVSLVVCVAISLAIYRRRSLIHCFALSLSSFAASVLAALFVLLCCYAMGISVRTESTGLMKLLLLQVAFLTLSTALLLPFDRLLSHLLGKVPEADPEYYSFYEVLNASLAWPNAIKVSESRRSSTKPKTEKAISPNKPSSSQSLFSKLTELVPVEHCLLVAMLIFVISGVGSCYVTVSSSRHDATAHALLESWSSPPLATSSVVVNKAANPQTPKENDFKIAERQWVEQKQGLPRLETISLSGRGVRIRHSISYQPSRFWIEPDNRDSSLKRVTSSEIELSDGTRRVVEMLVDEFGAKTYRINATYQRVAEGKTIDFTMESYWDSGRSLSESEQRAFAELVGETWQAICTEGDRETSGDLLAARS